MTDKRWVLERIKDEEIKQKRRTSSWIESSCTCYHQFEGRRKMKRWGRWRKNITERDAIHINNGSRLSDFRLNCFVEFSFEERERTETTIKGDLSVCFPHNRLVMKGWTMTLIESNKRDVKFFGNFSDVIFNPSSLSISLLLTNHALIFRLHLQSFDFKCFSL